MAKDTVTIEVPAGSTVLVNGKEVYTKPEFISRFIAGQVTHYLDNNGLIFDWCPCEATHRQGNVFLTEQDAIKESDRRALETRWLTRIAQLNHKHGWVCDWEGENQLKGYIRSCNYKIGKVYADISSFSKVRSTEHYFCPKAKEQLLKEFTDEELKAIYFGEIG